MVKSCAAEAGALHAEAARWRKTFDEAEAALLAAAREITEYREVAS
jgi:hypothetical protein